MDAQRFDRLVIALGSGNRRRVLLGLFAGTLMGTLEHLDAAAKRKRHKPRKETRHKEKQRKAKRRAAAQANDKVTICHKPGTPAEKTMEVPPQALVGHLGHGDYACATGCCPAGVPVCLDEAGNGECCPPPGQCGNGACLPAGCAGPDGPCGNGIACCAEDGTTCCNRTCARLNTDTNCGACGHTCPTGTRCSPDFVTGQIRCVCSIVTCINGCCINNRDVDGGIDDQCVPNGSGTLINSPNPVYQNTYVCGNRGSICQPCGNSATVCCTVNEFSQQSFCALDGHISRSRCGANGEVCDQCILLPGQEEECVNGVCVPR